MKKWKFGATALYAVVALFGMFFCFVFEVRSVGAWGCLCYLYSGMFEVFGFVARLVYRLAFPAYDDDGFTSSRGGGGAWYGE